MANPELGAKQVCPNCQAKFYDLNRRPAHCPKCGTDFDPEEALKLALSPGTQVYRMDRLRYADDQPMALEYATVVGWALAVRTYAAARPT